MRGFASHCRSALQWRSSGAGLDAPTERGKEIASMGPVVHHHGGSSDDWLKVVAEKENITIDPGFLEWAVWRSSRRLRIFRQRGYRIRLLSAAFATNALERVIVRRGHSPPMRAGSLLMPVMCKCGPASMRRRITNREDCRENSWIFGPA